MSSTYTWHFDIYTTLPYLQLVPPGEKITAELIRSLLGYVGDQITGVNGRLGDLRSSCNTTKVCPGVHLP